MVISVQCSSDNLVTCINDGMWPSGKAPGFGPGIRGFESLRPSQVEKISPERDKLESLGSESDPVTGVVF